MNNTGLWIINIKTLYNPSRLEKFNILDPPSTPIDIQNLNVRLNSYNVSIKQFSILIPVSLVLIFILPFI